MNKKIILGIFFLTILAGLYPIIFTPIPLTYAQSTSNNEGTEVNYLESSRCLECHIDEYEIWNASLHKRVNCETCHSNGQDHIDMNSRMPEVNSQECESCHEDPVYIPSSMQPVEKTICVRCHDNTILSESDTFSRIDFENHYVPIDCGTCHADHTPEINIAEAPYIPHLLENRTDCKLCHGPGGIKVFPESHINRPNNVSIECHIVGAGDKTEIPPQTSIIERMCTLCHINDGPNPLSIEHPEILNRFSNCLDCHEEDDEYPLSDEHPEFSIDLSDCLLCHGPRSILPLNSTHLERKEGTCYICHEEESELDDILENSLLLMSMPNEVKISDIPISYSAILSDEHNNPISEASIEFIINTTLGTFSIGNSMTNSTGIAILNHRYQNEGLVELDVVFQGNEKYSGSMDTKTISILSTDDISETQDSYLFGLNYLEVVVVVLIISIFLVYGFTIIQLINVSKVKKENKQEGEVQDKVQ
jgi:hypothetical protein